MLRERCLKDGDEDGNDGVPLTPIRDGNVLDQSDIMVGDAEGEYDEEEKLVVELRSMVPQGFSVFFMKDYDYLGRGATRRPIDQAGATTIPETTNDTNASLRQ